MSVTWVLEEGYQRQGWKQAISCCISQVVADEVGEWTQICLEIALTELVDKLAEK